MFIAETAPSTHECGINDMKDRFTPDFVHHYKGGEKKFGDNSPKPGRTNIIDEMIAEGDRVAVWTTSKREGADDGHMCSIWRLSEGKIAESWNMTSLQGHMQPD